MGWVLAGETWYCDLVGGCWQGRRGAGRWWDGWVCLPGQVTGSARGKVKGAGCRGGGLGVGGRRRKIEFKVLLLPREWWPAGLTLALKTFTSARPMHYKTLINSWDNNKCKGARICVCVYVCIG